MKYLDDALRKSPLGVWNSMPISEEPDWSNKSHTRGFGRFDTSALWRVSTMKELVGHYKHIMSDTYRNLVLAVVFFAGALLCFSLFTQSRDVAFGVFAIAFAALTSRHYCKAVGGYAGGWSDYEHDPVQMVPHNAYVLNNGWGLM